MAHHIEIYSAGCLLCKRTMDIVAVGKCAKCVMEVHDLNSGSAKVRLRAGQFNIKAAPSIIIDEKIKIEGVPGFGFMCSEPFYQWLEANFSMDRTAGSNLISMSDVGT